MSVVKSFVLVHKEDAERVLEEMKNIAKGFEVVTVGDMYDLVGIPSNHADSKLGWTNLDEAQIEYVVNNGWIVKLPDAEVIA